MQVSRKSVENLSFEPFSVTITFETPEEARSFFAVFNVPRITGFLRQAKIEPEILRRALSSSKFQADDFSTYQKLITVLQKPWL